MIVCTLAELGDPGAKGPFRVSLEDGERAVFVVRVGGRVAAYVDSCPHVGAPLEPDPDQFLDLTGTEIMCSLHGARFDPTSGRCTWGPCRGRGLTSVPVMVIDDKVWVGKDRPV